MRTKELQAKIDTVLASILDALGPASGMQMDAEGVAIANSTISTLVHARGELQSQNDVTEEPC